MADSQADKGIHLNVKVRSATGEEVYFKIKKNTALKKLDGCILHTRKPDSSISPIYLDMEDGDMIDASVEQTGGF
ncbi:hypothetical protein BLNAU_1785 [Blattamonas nauphoetae]|uniref:Rad60/SUMO-like domain-containing protein n=1 Tax=Blattamonas nauphoetae TaxID=2049346 RepID=A0ABQ9YHN4_9EUKA|nr:hypothetical protein BLNAU_1785 [Blattamonas nauphoetae]